MSLQCNLLFLILICFFCNCLKAEKIAEFNLNITLHPSEIWCFEIEGKEQKDEKFRKFSSCDEKPSVIPITIIVYETDGKISLKSEIRKINNSTFSIKKRDPDEIFLGTVKAISRDFLSLFNEPSKKNNNTFTVEYLIFVNYSLEVPQYATYSALQSWKFSLQYKILKDKTFIQENLSIIRQDRHESDSN